MSTRLPTYLAPGNCSQCDHPSSPLDLHFVEVGGAFGKTVPFGQLRAECQRCAYWWDVKSKEDLEYDAAPTVVA